MSAPEMQVSSKKSSGDSGRPPAPGAQSARSAVASGGREIPLEMQNGVVQLIEKSVGQHPPRNHAEILEPSSDAAVPASDDPAPTTDLETTDRDHYFSAVMQLESNNRQIDELRKRIPAFTCIVGCADCCGPVTASAEEMARLPVRTEAERAAALADWSCPHLGAQGCKVYAERPLICRLFGTTPRLLCPNGRRPVFMIDSETEGEIHHFLAATRQVLL